jgi:CRP-like cAMP-binding protein
MTEIKTHLQALMLLDDQPLRLDPGQPLFTEGQPSDGRMYIVREGTLQLRARGRTLETLEPGGLVGEMALIDPAPRSASAIAGAGCVVAAVDERSFHELVKRVPPLALELLRIMVKRLRQTTARTLAKTSAKARRRKPARRAGPRQPRARSKARRR